MERPRADRDGKRRRELAQRGLEIVEINAGPQDFEEIAGHRDRIGQQQPVHAPAGRGEIPQQDHAGEKQRLHEAARARRRGSAATPSRRPRRRRREAGLQHRLADLVMQQAVELVAQRGELLRGHEFRLARMRLVDRDDLLDGARAAPRTPRRGRPETPPRPGCGSRTRWSCRCAPAAPRGPRRASCGSARRARRTARPSAGSAVSRPSARASAARWRMPPDSWPG